MTIQKYARVGGFCYLICILTGMFSLAYVPRNLIDYNNAAQTFQDISEGNTLFRLSIASTMLCYVSFFVLAIFLYKIFESVNKLCAQIMVLLVAVGVCLSLITLTEKFAALEITSSRKYFDNVSQEYLESLLMLHLKKYNWALTVCELFWGTWFLPFALLIIKSKYLPKIFAVLLIMGCVGYLTDAFGSILFKDFYKGSIANNITLPAAIGEFGICLWLLIFGVRRSKEV